MHGCHSKKIKINRAHFSLNTINKYLVFIRDDLKELPIFILHPPDILRNIVQTKKLEL